MVPPFTILGFAGVTAIDTIFAEVTVTLVEPETVVLRFVGGVAVIVRGPPAARPVTNPWLPGSLLTCATGFGSGVGSQPTSVVRSWVVPSLKEPTANSCLVSPAGIDTLAGTTRIEVRVASFTVAVVEPDTPWRVPVIGVDPALTPVTNPSGLTVAMALLPELQVTWLVRIWVLPSLKMPVAISCTEVPLAMVGSGVIMIDCKVALVTMKVAVPVVPLNLAVTVVAPTPAPLDSPLVGAELLTFATAEFAEDQVADSVTSLVVPFL